MGLPARIVLNMVYVDLARATPEEDRPDLENWMTCTLAEAEAWAEENEREVAEERLRLARLAGEVVM